jgi:hypothetical protein
MERDIAKLFNESLEESLKEKMVDAVCKLNTLIAKGGNVNREELIISLFEANRAISNICMGDDELFTEHEYHFFEGARGGWVAQGREVKVTDRYD